MVSRKEPPTTGTSSVSPAIIPSFCSTSLGIAKERRYDPETCIVPMAGRKLLEPVVKGYQKKGLRLLFRGDAVFAKPELYEYLEQGKIGCAIRLPANQVIQEQIQPLLERPTEWPSREPIVSY